MLSVQNRISCDVKPKPQSRDEDLAAFVEPSRAWKLSMQKDELVLDSM